MNGKKWIILVPLLLAACGATPESGGGSEIYHSEPRGIYARETSDLQPAGGFQPLPATVGGIYLESQGEILVVYRVDGGEIGRLEYKSRPVISDQVKWGSGKDQIVDVDGGQVDLCVDMGEGNSGPCYKVLYTDGVWLVQSQIHDATTELTEAEPLAESLSNDALQDPQNWKVRIYVDPVLNQDDYIEPPVEWGGMRFSEESDWLIVTKIDEGQEVVRVQALEEGIYAEEDKTRGTTQLWYEGDPEKSVLRICFWYSEFGSSFDGLGPCWMVRWNGSSWVIQNPGD